MLSARLEEARIAAGAATETFRGARTVDLSDKSFREDPAGVAVAIQHYLELTTETTSIPPYMLSLEESVQLLAQDIVSGDCLVNPDHHLHLANAQERFEVTPTSRQGIPEDFYFIVSIDPENKRCTVSTDPVHAKLIGIPNPDDIGFSYANPAPVGNIPDSDGAFAARLRELCASR